MASQGSKQGTRYGHLVYTGVNIPAPVLNSMVVSPFNTTGEGLTQARRVTGLLHPRHGHSPVTLSSAQAVDSSYSLFQLEDSPLNAGFSPSYSLSLPQESHYLSSAIVSPPCPVSRSPSPSAYHNAGSRMSNSEPEGHEVATTIHQRMSAFLDTSLTGTLSPFQEREHQDLQSIIATASHCYSARDYTQMIDILQSAIVSSDTPGKLAGAVQFGLGIAHFKLKQHELATASFLTLEHIARSSKSREDLCLAYYYLAEVEYSRSKFLPASTYYARAMDNYGESEVGGIYRIEVPSESILCCRQANSLRYHGTKIMEAVVMYKKAIKLAQKAGSRKDELSGHTSLGNLYQGIGDYANAIEEYELSSEIARYLRDDATLGWVYGNLGNAYLGQNKPGKALEYLQKSLKLTLDSEANPQSIGRAYNNLGTAYQSVNQLEKAKEYYDMGLNQAVYADDLPGQARVHGNIGNLFMVQDRFQEAIRCYTETLSISKDRSTQTTAYHNRGSARYELAEINRKRYMSSEVGQAAKGKSPLIFTGADMTECEAEHQFPDLPRENLREYTSAKNDLEKVQKHHEQTFQDIKGSSHGLSLSVSLFETHARTFQRLQDCSYMLGQWHQALCFAEQSRARTLGELMLQKKLDQLKHPYRTPLDLPQITSIVGQQTLPVVYMSYTSARLLVWVLVPLGETADVSINMFQVTFKPSQFNGKPFDHMLRFSLSESLTDARMQMYGTSTYTEHTLLDDLYELIVNPLKKIFKAVPALEKQTELKEVVLILDTHTKLIPMAALQDPDTHQFLGDSIRFHCMHSLLTMGILNQLPSAPISIPTHSPDMCIVGNPTTPRFQYNGEEWNLGRLPFATEEAEWVAHILRARPTLHEQATKEVVMTMLNKAKVVHLATHGSASAGFLVFAGVTSKGIESTSVLLHPHEIEVLVIQAALVVLSSCDSGRGAMKAEGIQGIARSFLLAGAMSILTSLWRVPDESASFFMQFFYRYLVDGYPSLEALQKAILSIRSFVKYGDYIHWSGYQLTGRQIQFATVEDQLLIEACGPSSPFPRLSELHKLETSLITQAQAKPDVQLIVGCIGMSPVELVVDYITKHEAHYTGGIFWLNRSCEEALTSGLQSIADALLLPSPDGKTVIDDLDVLFTSAPPDPMLLVLDNIEKFSVADNVVLSALARRRSTHIVVTSTGIIPQDTVTLEAHKELVRGCNVVDLKPLSSIQSAQRVVYFLMKRYDLCPMNEEQDLFEQVADLVRGSPYVVELVCHSANTIIKDHGGQVLEGLKRFKYEVVDATLDELGSESDGFEWVVGVFISKLLSSLNLPAVAFFQFCCLSLVSTTPLHESLILTLEEFLTALLPNTYIAWQRNLLHNRLLYPYPRPVVQPPSKYRSQRSRPWLVDRYFYIPDVIATTVYSLMEPQDKVMACCVMHRVLAKLMSRGDVSESFGLHLQSVQRHLVTVVKEDLPAYSEDIFDAVFQQYMARLNKGVGVKSDPDHLKYY